MVQLSCQPQGSLVQETSSRLSMFHPVSPTCYMSASRRLKPFSPLAARLHHRGAGMRRGGGADGQARLRGSGGSYRSGRGVFDNHNPEPKGRREDRGECPRAAEGELNRSWQPPSPTSSQESNSTTCICESWPEKPFTNFLDAMESLLQEVQSGAITSAEVSWGPGNRSWSVRECQGTPRSSVRVTHFLPHQRRWEWMYLNTAVNYLMTSVIQENLNLLHFCNATFRHLCLHPNLFILYKELSIWKLADDALLI